MMPPPPRYDLPTRPTSPPPPYVPPPAFDRYDAEYRIRRRMLSAYAGAPVNHPDPAQRCGALGAAAVNVLVSAVVDELERMMAKEPAIEPREPKDDEYLPEDVPLFQESKHEAQRQPPASRQARNQNPFPEVGDGDGDPDQETA